MVELQTHHAEFTAAAIDLFCLSYDEPDALAEFVAAHGIEFPLLSDPDSEVIKQFGILNTLIAEDDHPWHGIPFPGCYVIDADGVIIEKFFEHNLALRPSAGQLLRAAQGEQVVLPPARPGEDVAVDVTLDADAMAPGVVHELVATFTVPEGRHLYSKPVPAGMVAAVVELDDGAGLVVRDTIAPPTRPLTLAGTGDTLQVYDGSFQLRVPLTHNGSDTTKLEDGSRTVIVGGTVAWQSCDDQACDLPQEHRFEITVNAAPIAAYKIDPAHFERMSTRRQT